MDISVDLPRYFRGACDAVFSLGAAREATPGADYRVHLELHDLGWLGNRLQSRSDGNLVAKLYATLGIVNDLRAICFCRIEVRRDVPAELTVEFLLRHLLDQTQLWVGGRELFGDILVACGVGSQITSVPRLNFHLHVDFDRSRHYQIPRMSNVDTPGREIGPYVEIRISERLVVAEPMDEGNAKDECLVSCASDRTVLRRPCSE